MQESEIAALEAGAALVTASQRLARHLLAAYGQRQQEQGRAVWEAPDILPWAQWLERGWQEAFGLLDPQEPQPLLSSFQELSLWEAVIGEAEAEPLLQVSAAARAAREAWQLLHAWQLSLPPGGLGSEDVSAFAGWAKAYRRRCDAGRYLDSARLPDALARAYAAGHLPRPRQLLTAGFDEFTPQQHTLFETLRAAGVPVSELAPGERRAQAARVALDDRRAEIRAAAAWARAALEAGATRIGIVVPDLSVQRAGLVRELDDALLPEALLAGAAPLRPYNISLGEPLARWPVIHAALLLLEFGSGSLPVARLGTLLRSPFVAGASGEAAARARLDAALRQAGEETVGVSTLLRRAHGTLTDANPHTAVPLLHAQWRAWRDAIPARSQRLAPSDWSELFARLLQLGGWPGDGPLDSEGHQAVNSWRELLAAFAAQDLVSERLAYGDALAMLRRMAAERVFQPQTPAAPVQVLGLLEASGLEFDRLWVMGLDDESWPPSPRPNPFLPRELQRARGLPHASAERELEFARRLTERLAMAAESVVFSYPRNAGDEKRRASPLLQPYPELPAATLPPPAAGLARQLHAAGQLETLRDEQAPALAAGSEVKGGTRLFQYQAACPFRAFAVLRLDARAPEEPEPGLDAMARGMLLHRALEALWNTLGSHAALAAMSEEALQAAIGKAVGVALDELARDRSQTLTGRFRELETRRLTRLLRVWVDFEEAREPFRVVAAEQESAIRLGGLVFKGRMDRVDELEDGSRVILDYKSGKTRIKAWESERPEEPQLPLYAVDMQQRQPVSAVMFAQLRPGQLAFNGLAARAGIAPGVKPAGENDGDWPALLAGWQQTLTALAESYRAGDARVDPKKFPSTCQHCGLQALCRVHERQLAVVEDDEGGEGDDDG